VNFRKTAIFRVVRNYREHKKNSKKVYLLLALFILYLFDVDFLSGKDLLKANNEILELQHLDINSS